MKQIHYLSADEQYKKGLKDDLIQQQIALLPYSKSDSCEMLVLFSPFKIGGIRTSPAPIWKRYLRQKSPETKLIVAGFKVAKDNNYINLLRQPEDWNMFMKQAKKVKENWIPIDTGGMNMVNKMRRFYKGHGKESVIDVLGAVRDILNAINTRKSQGYDYQAILKEVLDTEPLFEGIKAEAEADIIMKWKIFRHRWNNYLPLFNYLPFYQEMFRMDEAFGKIHLFFEQDCKNEDLYEPSYFDTIKNITEDLRNIRDKYVN